MDLIPAIDLLDGAAVRLVQGDYARQAASVTDPDDRIRGWVRAGVRWLHLVDLDGARAGGPVNLDAARRLAATARSVADEMNIELGGGLRTEADIEAALAAGVDVALLGTAAIEDAAFLERSARRWARRIAVSIDCRDGRVALDGWTRDVAVDPIELARRVADHEISHLVITDVRRDGTRHGPNVALLGRMRAALPDVRLVAAGGIATASQLRELAASAIDGAIVGLALVDGSLSVEEALRAASATGAEVA